MIDGVTQLLVVRYLGDSSDANAHALASHVAQNHEPVTRKVLVSTGFGAGWSTWMSDPNDAEIAREFPPLVAAVEAGECIEEALAELIPLLSEKPYTGGLYQSLRVEEVTGPYYIDEYDGAETLRYGVRL